MTRISRRSLLGAASALVGSALLPRAAWAGTPAPKRLVFVFSPVGTIYGQWAPTGTESNFTLSPILAPLAPYKSKLLVLDGINVEAARHGDGDDHMRGIGCMLTGTELLPGNVQGGGGTPAGMGGGISLDQYVANVIGTTTTYKSLEFGAYVKNSDVWSRMSYAGANQPLPPMEDPVKAFQRIFSSSAVSPAELARLLKRRQSVLDHAVGTLKTLESSVSGDDRARVQAHIASVEQIEKQLLSKTSACLPPTQTGPFDLNDVNNFPAVGRLQMDMLVTSLLCDLTRVATMQFSKASSMMSFPWLQIPDAHHDLSHRGDSDVAAVANLVTINNWYASQFAYLLGKMDSVVEGNGLTMLDNSLVVWMNELAKGNIHSHEPTPIVIAGSAGGALKTGRYLKFAQPQLAQNMLVTLANLMGVPTTMFGNPAYCTGPLAL